MIQDKKKFQVGDLVLVSPTPPISSQPVVGIILKANVNAAKYSFYKETNSLVLINGIKQKIRNSILEKINK